jgi:hypothetical protein
MAHHEILDKRGKFDRYYLKEKAEDKMSCTFGTLRTLAPLPHIQYTFSLYSIVSTQRSCPHPNWSKGQRYADWPKHYSLYSLRP